MHPDEGIITHFWEDPCRELAKLVLETSSNYRMDRCVPFIKMIKNLILYTISSSNEKITVPGRFSRFPNLANLVLAA